MGDYPAQQRKNSETANNNNFTSQSVDMLFERLASRPSLGPVTRLLCKGDTPSLTSQRPLQSVAATNSGFPPLFPTLPPPSLPPPTKSASLYSRAPDSTFARLSDSASSSLAELKSSSSRPDMLSLSRGSAHLAVNERSNSFSGVGSSSSCRELSRGVGGGDSAAAVLAAAAAASAAESPWVKSRVSRSGDPDMDDVQFRGRFSRSKNQLIDSFNLPPPPPPPSRISGSRPSQSSFPAASPWYCKPSHIADFRSFLADDFHRSLQLPTPAQQQQQQQSSSVPGVSLGSGGGGGVGIPSGSSAPVGSGVPLGSVNGSILSSVEHSVPPPLGGSGFNARPQILDVWASNLVEEFGRIRDVVERYQYVALDTEFPGVVARPTDVSPDYCYKTVKCNVDLLKVIQLGITLADGTGSLPSGTSTWQFNFKFDLDTDLYAQNAIDFLKSCGIDFLLHQEKGIDIHEFGELIISSGLVMNKDVKWISFHGSYDFGYLLKLLTCEVLPSSEPQFFELLHDFFPSLYDIKYILESCPDLQSSTSLQKVAEMLNVTWSGPQHQAGSDSLVTCQSFFKLMDVYFDNVIDDNIFSGVIYGLGKATLPPPRQLSTSMPKSLTGASAGAGVGGGTTTGGGGVGSTACPANSLIEKNSPATATPNGPPNATSQLLAQEGLLVPSYMPLQPPTTTNTKTRTTPSRELSFVSGVLTGLTTNDQKTEKKTTEKD